MNLIKLRRILLYFVRARPLKSPNWFYASQRAKKVANTITVHSQRSCQLAQTAAAVVVVSGFIVSYSLARAIVKIVIEVKIL